MTSALFTLQRIESSVCERVILIYFISEIQKIRKSETLAHSNKFP